METMTHSEPHLFLDALKFPVTMRLRVSIAHGLRTNGNAFTKIAARRGVTCVAGREQS